MILRGDRNQCRACGCYFNSTAAFDKHRVGSYSKDRRCLSPIEMADKGFRTNRRGFLVFGANPMWKTPAAIRDVAAGAAERGSRSVSDLGQQFSNGLTNGSRGVR